MTDLLALGPRIAHLLGEYCHCIDDGRYEEWAEFFTEDCDYQINTRQNVARGFTTGLIHCDGKGMLIDRIASLRRANIFEPHIYRHLLGPTRILGETKGVIAARTGFGIVRVMESGSSDLFLTGLYEDEIVAEGDRLKFRRRLAILDSSRIDTLIVIPV